MDYCYAHCACCARRPRTRERSRGLYFVPLQMGVFVEEDDYEMEPLYPNPYQYFPQVLPSRRSRKWSCRAKEEEEEEEEEAFKSSPTHFFYFEDKPRKKKFDACKKSQEEFLHSLAHRMEALELGLQRLTTVRNASTPQKQRMGRENVARSNPLGDDFSHPQNPPSSEVIQENFSKKKSFMMNPEEAAVIIQSRFRAYLVRRSETLRHLRDLAMVKSTLKELHCLYTDSRYRRLLCRDADERNLFSERATALLLKVDSIQGCESIIVRNAKTVLSKDLVRLLDNLDDMAIQCAESRKMAQPRVDKRDIMMPDRVVIPRDCIECSGEVDIPAEDEEEMEELTAWRAPSSEKRYLPRPLCNSNRGRDNHGPGHLRSSDFDASACTNRKTRVPLKCRKKFGSSGHLLRNEMIRIDDMDDVGLESYCPALLKAGYLI